MADINLITGAVVSLKLAGDIAKGLLDLRTLAEVQGKVVDLQSIILSAQSSALAAQSEQAAMIQRVRDLEEEVARVKAWHETKQRYELKEIAAGIFAHSLKQEGEPAEPLHWICTKCYEDGMRSIIQRRNESDYSTTYVCPRCDHNFKIKTGKQAPDVGALGAHLNR